MNAERIAELTESLALALATIKGGDIVDAEQCDYAMADLNAIRQECGLKELPELEPSPCQQED